MKAAFNLDSTETQHLTGRFENYPEEEYSCRISFNRFRLWEAEVVFDEAVNVWDERIPVSFIIKDETELLLIYSGARIGGIGDETRARIHKIVKKESGSKYFCTGAVKGLLYFPRQFDLMGLNVSKEEVKIFEKGRPKTFYYFQCSYQSNISEHQINKAILGLSILSNSSLRLTEHSDGETLVLYENVSAGSEIYYSGTGLMHFPIGKAAIEKMVVDVPWKQLWRFHLMLSNFVRTTDMVHQLYRGCALLDYLIELFDRSKYCGVEYKNQPKKIQKLGKSLKLYGLLFNLGLNEPEKRYIEEIFPGLTLEKFQIAKKFEFYELRDAHIHRGELFMTQEQLWQFARCNVSVNEIIRMLIPHLSKITQWQYTNKDFYRAIDSEDIVNKRQELIPWRDVMGDIK